MLRKNHLKSVSSENIGPREIRRTLQWLPLAPPDYIVEPLHLIESFVELECVYEGTLNNVSVEIDLRKRTDVLRIIDAGHTSKSLASSSLDCILNISAHNIKLNRRVVPEPLLLRIPLEEIRSVAYVRDNALHYIVILHMSSLTKEPNNGNLTVLTTETHIRAEEICSLMTQCFQILYTETTLRHFDQQLYSTISHSGCNYSPEDIAGINGRKLSKNQMKLMYEEDKTLNEIESVYSELSPSKAEFLQNYMLQLQQVLTKDEMKQFASSLGDWQRGSPFESFCRKTKLLLGPNRIRLLADMKYFIDPADKFTLDQFINDSNSPTKSRSPHSHWSQLLAKSPLPLPMQRSLSYASTSNGVLSIYDEDNSLRDDFSSPIKNNYNDKSFSEYNGDDEFASNIDTFFQKIEDLDLILSSDG